MHPSPTRAPPTGMISRWDSRPPRKRARADPGDFEATLQQWAAMRVRLQSLGCWLSGGVRDSLRAAREQGLISAQEHERYMQLHVRSNTVRH